MGEEQHFPVPETGISIVHLKGRQTIIIQLISEPASG